MTSTEQYIEVADALCQHAMKMTFSEARLIKPLSGALAPGEDAHSRLAMLVFEAVNRCPHDLLAKLSSDVTAKIWLRAESFSVEQLINLIYTSTAEAMFDMTSAEIWKAVCAVDVKANMYTSLPSTPAAIAFTTYARLGRKVYDLSMEEGIKEVVKTLQAGDFKHDDREIPARKERTPNLDVRSVLKGMQN